MSGKAKPKVYWDSCVFLAWIQEEGPPQRKPGDMDGLERVARLLNKGELVLFTSVITHTEVLASKMDATAKKRYTDIFQRPEVIQVAVDGPVAILASEIRDYYVQARDRLPEDQRKKALTVSTPDALHLATAIIYGAAEFHTFDGDDEHNRDGLLRLGREVATHTLEIKKPDDQQLDLLTDIPPLPPEQNTKPVTTPAEMSVPTAQNVSTTDTNNADDLSNIPASDLKPTDNLQQTGTPKNTSQPDEAPRESNPKIPEEPVYQPKEGAINEDTTKADQHPA